jgi:hypothetical protein
VFEFRVTKYDPAFRDNGGAYTRNEWTSIGDIGRAFSGEVLTEAEYQRVEDAYTVVVIAFLQEAGVTSLKVVGLENHSAIPLSFGEGSILDAVEAGIVLRRVLREEFWCRLERPNAFIHLGYDYYMYVGVPSACPTSEALARRLGLFVEPFRSPYTKRGSCRSSG